MPDDIDPTYYGMSKTEKGPAYYPGETVHGCAGDARSDKGHAGPGTTNLSPPSAATMGPAMMGAGLPPADGIRMGVASSPNPCPPGPPVDPGRAVRSPLPPGPDANPGAAAPSPLSPGPSVEQPGAQRGGRQGRRTGGHGPASGGAGQLPPGVGV